LDCRAGKVADLPAVPGGKVSSLNHSPLEKVGKISEIGGSLNTELRGKKLGAVFRV
jgi:hypothetical protein